MRSCILIAERDRLLAESLLASFGRSGIAAHWENELSQICSAMRSLLPNVLVLGNIGSVPDLSYLCQVLRSDSMTAAIPVLFVLADQWLDELSMGTVDYVSRTGSPEAIVEHTKRLMGTNAFSDGKVDVLSLHGITICKSYFSVTRNDRPLSLTRTEFGILWTLMSQAGRPFSRSELVRYACVDSGTTFYRTIDAHVRSLRKKLGASRDLIETVREIGYRFRGTSLQNVMQVSTDPGTVPFLL